MHAKAIEKTKYKRNTSNLRKCARVLRGDLRRRLGKSGEGWLLTLGSRDRGRKSKDDAVKMMVRIRTTTMTADCSSAKSGSGQQSKEEVTEVLRNTSDYSG